MPSFPQLFDPLCDGPVCVRVAAERDIPEVLIAYQDDPDLHRWMGEERPPSGAELGRRAERAEADRAAGRALTMTIVDGENDICLGQIYVFAVDWDNLRAELGIWIAPEQRGRDLAPRALRMVGRWLLRESGLQRVHVLTEPNNESMLRAARQAGFSYEGVLRGYVRGHGRRIDAVMLSLVRRDLGAEDRRSTSGLTS